MGVMVRGGLFRQLIHQNGPPPFFAVLDRRNRLLVMDSRAALWPDEDLERFAARAGLAYVPFAPEKVRKARGRRVARLDISARSVPYILVAMVIVTIPLFVLGAGTGVPVWILAIAAVGLPVAGAFVFGRLFDTYILRVAARRAGGQPPR